MIPLRSSKKVVRIVTWCLENQKALVELPSNGFDVLCVHLESCSSEISFLILGL